MGPMPSHSEAGAADSAVADANAPSRDATARGSRPRFALGVVLVALGTAVFAIAFRSALSSLYRRLVGASDVVSALSLAPWWLRVLLPAVGGLTAGTLSRFAARGAGGHGVGDVMEAVVLGRVRLSMRVTLLKSIGSWCAIASGGSIGREGPLIQFGGAAGKVVGQWLGVSTDDTRILIAAGTASGFAAAYNTPISAVLFVIEVVTGLVVLDALLPTLVATVIATASTRLVVGEGPIYGQRAFSLRGPTELLAFAALGFVAAFGAQAFTKFLSLSEDMLRRTSITLPWRSALGGMIAGGVIALLPQVAGNGYEPLNALLDGAFSVGFVALLLLGKIFATTASVSSGSPGGVFTPTLLIGGGIGFVHATALAWAGATVGPPAGYALVGMAAATAATTHAPLMAAVLAFELSGDYAIALPLLLSTAIATATARKLTPDSVYTAELRRRGVAWQVTMEGRRIAS